jgi:predicted nucleotide-binding protein (sugar kinase/HSP70/actin superfamily)
MNHVNDGKSMKDLGQLSLDSSMDEIEQELKRFEDEERKRLGLPTGGGAAHWIDKVPRLFTKEQRAHTTILVSGLTMAHDLFIQSALRGIGYKVLALDVADNDALQFGREYGNRGQCNPTYFTVGNLIKHLDGLRQQGISTEDIIKNNLFITAGACGPCRFGTYVTEYRKALRDSGFDGFRVLLFQQTGGLKQATGDELGLQMDPTFFWGVIRSVMIGDVVNALGYRIRPYEVEAGSTTRALERSKRMIADAFENRTSMMVALYKVRKELSAVKVDRTRTKPKVGIIGEFWAMTTEGDGNYALQSFLEGEGAEADIQLVTTWLLYMLWQSYWDTEQRMVLRGTDKSNKTEKQGSKFSLEGVDIRKRLLTLQAADKIMRGMFQTVAHALGLYDYHLADMNEIADVSHAFYDNQLRGGEGHMEVGKLILNVARSKVNMTLSVKPFGCMPSSSVSDGVQSLITEMYPGAIFLPIETNGDGAVNVYSRVQMQLFKAKQAAAHEVKTILEKNGVTMEQVQAHIKKHPEISHAFHRSPHVAGCTTADLVAEVVEHMNRWKTRRSAAISLLTKGKLPKKEVHQERDLVDIARAAASKAKIKKAVIKVDDGAQLDESRPRIPTGRKALNVLS